MHRHGYRLIISGFVLALACLIASPSFAAEKISVRYGLFEQSLPVVDLEDYAKTGRVSSSLGGFLRFTNREQQQALRQLLQINLPVDLVSLDHVLNAPTGVKLLSQLSKAIVDGDRAGVQALRAAAVLGIKPEGLSVLSFLDAYPDRQLALNLPDALSVVDAVSAKPPNDTLPDIPLWQTLVDYQATVGHNKQYQACLFGDSISAQLLSSLEPKTANFALGGMSSVSLVAQLQRLVAQNVKCQQAVIAIGTNDAWYTIADDRFSQNLQTAIDLTRQLGATKIVLLPAFYSTLAASKNPELAGPIPRVEAINRLIDTVAKAENVPV